MSFVISPSASAALRFARINRHMATYLHDLDLARFRGLGERQCEAFVREGVSYCDRLGLGFLEHIEYVHFIMYFLGTHFYLDPRYQPIAERLADRGVVANQRIEGAHRLFRVFGDRFIGEGLRVARDAMARFNVELERQPGTELGPHRILAAFHDANALGPEERLRFPGQAIVEAAAGAARELAIDVPSGHDICFALALWLGTGFHRDPLFPWVREVPARVEGSARQRASALKDYALKRLQKMLV
jgi:hypothetical protein